MGRPQMEAATRKRDEFIEAPLVLQVDVEGVLPVVGWGGAEGDYFGYILPDGRRVKALNPFIDNG